MNHAICYNCFACHCLTDIGVYDKEFLHEEHCEGDGGIFEG